MRQYVRIFGVLSLVVIFGAGCARVTTKVVEKPRVDQEIQGNQGVLAGTQRQPLERKKTRKVLETTVELATLPELNPWKLPSKEEPAAAATTEMVTTTTVTTSTTTTETELPSIEVVEPDVSLSATDAIATPIEAPELNTYIVKSGDTLEKIAYEVYGDGRQWQRIYDANKHILSGPDKIYKGQELVVPDWQEADEAPSTLK